MLHAQSDQLSDIAQLLKGDSHNLGEKVRAVLERTRQLEKELQQLKEQAAAQESANLSSKAEEINGCWSASWPAWSRRCCVPW